MGLTRFRNYLSFVKFSHTIFALPFAVIGFFLGTQQPQFDFSWVLLLLVLLCMLFARSAAMGFNRWADREIDRKNPRTGQREIPRGAISPRAALIFVIACSIAFVACTWFINFLCFCLSPVALFVILGYSYTKRFTSLSHFVLGLGLSLAPIGAYLAVTGRFDILPLLYSGLVFFWVAGFDIIYSLQDKDFDKKEGLRSIPARLGVKKSLIVSALSHLLCVALLLLACLLYTSPSPRDRTRSRMPSSA
jgi:4-hydroxybenzoate polyprenyltransferase